MTATPATTVDADEIARFTAIAEEWWDESGKFAPLHRINPVRLDYIRLQALKHFGREDKIAAFEGLTALDIGCGGGLVSEPLARMGFAVTGIDGGDKNIKTAAVHAEQSGLAIDYRCATAEALAGLSLNGGRNAPQTPTASPPRTCSVDSYHQYDLVLALEIIEHVADVELFLESCAALVKPGGMLIMSTLNRTVKAYGMAILGAEYLLRWLPRGTHDWKKFLKPHEIVQPLQRRGLELTELRGLVMNPLRWKWEISAGDLEVNYLVVMKK